MAARDLSLSPPDDRQPALRGWLRLVLQVGAVARAARRHLAVHVGGSELSEQEFLVLWLCDDAALTVRGHVDRLRRRNLLQFERLGRDRRRQVWQLTAAGQTLLADVCGLLASAPPQGNLNITEQQQLLSLL